jgi:3-methylcrotonyl-CoA carboxylase beta subunit
MPKSMQGSARDIKRLCQDLAELETKLRSGGGPKKIEKQHADGKLTARERVGRLLDPGQTSLEIGLLIGYDKYDGQAPAAGVVTVLGIIESRPAVVVANDATVKAGAWWPETITKILRAQEIAMRNRLPIVYLVDSAGVNLPYQDAIFPGQYGAARIFYYNSLMRRRFRLPQISAVMGPCIAGGAYLPALSDIIIMVEGTSFMGLGGPNLVRGAVGQVTDAETLGGAKMHTSISGVAHYRVANDDDCLALIRAQFRQMPARSAQTRTSTPPRFRPESIYEIVPADHRLPYRIEDVLDRILDADGLLEFQPDYAPELLCGVGKLDGFSVGVIANRRGFLKTAAGPRIGGIVYPESARKVAYFVENAERHRLPLLYIQDVSGFMVVVGPESDGIIRAGAEMVEAMATATVPKITLVINHASGAGYYAMAGQGFDPNFTLSWPTARIGVMEGDSAVQAMFGPELEKLKGSGQPISPDLEAKIEGTREAYDRWLDAKHAAASGHCDALIDPTDTRKILSFLLHVTSANGGGDHLPIQLLAPAPFQTQSTSQGQDPGIPGMG